MAIITLTTDFGTKDQYVGSLYAVILSINPKARIVDITHEVPSYNIAEGAYLLGTTFPLFPKGTIHLAVVDPGVGSSRKPILIQTKNYFFVGPDNGLFSMVPLREKIRGITHLTNRAYFRKEVSGTFHGRDVFSPVAAHLSRGVEPRKMGTPLAGFKKLPLFDVKMKGNQIEGKIIAIDKFGNAVTNIPREIFDRKVGRKKFRLNIVGALREAPLPTRLSHAYSDVPKGKPVLVIGSTGFLEIALNQGSFARLWKITTGQIVLITTWSESAHTLTS